MSRFAKADRLAGEAPDRMAPPGKTLLPILREKVAP
jgi:hypothetical protein